METVGITEAQELLESAMDDNGDFVEEETLDEPSAVSEDYVEDFDQEEPEAEESEEESEEEESEEDSESEEESEEEEGQLFEIEIDGEAYEVNLEELQSGYLRNEQLLKRQSELEEQYQAKIEEADQAREEYLSRLENIYLEANVGLKKFENINWEQLKATDPESYKDALVQYMEAKEQASKLSQQRNTLHTLHTQAQALKHEAYLKRQREIASRLIPEIQEEGFVDNLVNYGESIGFTKDEVLSIADAKALFVLNQARLYSQSQKKQAVAKEKLSKELPPVVRPGAPKTKGQEQGRKAKALKARLGQTHDIRDAAALLEGYI